MISESHNTPGNGGPEHVVSESRAARLGVRGRREGARGCVLGGGVTPAYSASNVCENDIHVLYIRFFFELLSSNMILSSGTLVGNGAYRQSLPDSSQGRA